MRLLLVEDDNHVAAALSAVLARHGFDVTHARSGEEALQALVPEGNGFGVVLLDLGLPDQDGYEVCGKIRKRTSTPVIMVTARSDVRSRIHGLNLGADDYVVKPFDLAELLARVESLLRRHAWSERRPAPASSEDGMPSRLALGENWVDFTTYEAQTRQGRRPLSQKEVAVLRVFASRPGRVVTRRELLAAVWQLPSHPNTRVVDNVIVALRRAFEESATQPRHILSVRGVGYRFVP